MKYRTLIDCISPGVHLEDIQITGVIRTLLEKKMLLVYDTGLGKTFIASVILRALLNRNPNSKHIVIVLKDQDIQTPATIRSITGAKVIFTDASSRSLTRFFNKWDNNDIFIVTYNCFQNIDFLQFLYINIPQVTSFIIDEAHLASNWNTSNQAWLIRSFTAKVEYVVALTATPITSNRAQFPLLRNLINRDFTYRKYEVMSVKDYAKGYLQINRKDYGMKGNYKSEIIWCDPLPHQIGNLHGNIFQITKGSGAVNQANAVIETLRREQGNKIIIYVHYHDSRQWLEKNIKEAGFSFVSLHGKITNRKERTNILEKFNNNECNILITSITTALDISADTIIFYEFTTAVKQMIGRPHRGLAPKNLNIYFILTRDTAEIFYFSKYIYYRSLDIQYLLGKDYSEIIAVGNELLTEMKEED